MLAGRLPSLTAMIVAFARGAVPARPGEAAALDPVAAALLPRPVGAALRGARRAASRSDRVDRALRAATLGLLDHIALRTAAIDRVVTNEAGRGTTQLVVLGAGLDARALRLGALAGSTVFEIDHPATQAYKRPRALAIPRVSDVRFVAVDFERDDLGERLEASGHDAASPSVFVWEGVTPYLTADAIGGTLDAIARRAGRGSVLAMTYGTPELGSLPAALRPLVRPAFGLLGEPLLGLLTPEEAASRVEARGFAVEDDAGSSTWAERQGAGPPRFTIAERLLVARRS